MFCVRCGSNLPDGAKYCQNCGEVIVLSEEIKKTIENTTEENDCCINTKTKSLRKKITTILIAVLALVITVLVGNIIYKRTKSSIEIDGIFYEKEQGEYHIIGYSESPSVLEIPSEIYGKPVVSIGWGAFSGCESLTSVTLPDSVKKIDGAAFSKCPNLTSVKLPKTLEFWGNSAFYECTGLTEFTIPNGITRIGSNAFSDCYNLTKITIPPSVNQIGSSAFSGCANLKNIYISDLGAWCNITFESGDSNPLFAASSYETDLCLKGREIAGELIIPESATQIGLHAFTYCEKITSVIISENVTEISNCAFRECEALEQVIFQNGNLKSIGADVFENCEKITRIVFPNTLTSIGRGVLKGCNKIESVTFTFDGVSTDNLSINIFGHLFGATDGVFQHTKVPSSLTTVAILGPGVIPDSAFLTCTSLTNVIIEADQIGGQSFYNCRNLTNVTIGRSVKKIGESAFGLCEKIESIKFEGTATEWEGIEKSGWNKNSSIKRVECRDRTINV